jgi:hypothetical protein
MLHVRCRRGMRILLSCALAGAVLAGFTAPAAAQTVTAWGQDDWNTSTLVPSPVTAVYSCPWVDTGLANAGFTPANGWNFVYAGQANAAFVQPDLTITRYDPWVVNSPNVVGLDGVTRNRGVVNQDAGGAVFQLKYTPHGTDPVNIHFIQAYSESLNGGAFSSHLDNGGSTSPFYDALGVSGLHTLAGNASWFQDTPYDSEMEIEDYHTDVQFQVFICTDAVAAGVHTVTLYGGDWWGYQYSTTDVPAPASLALLSAGGLLASRRRRRA